MLGSGGMTNVYEATQESLGRSVAVKVRRVMSREHDHILRERFINSVQLHSRLNHPNIVSVVDLVKSPNIDAAVLEYLSGPTLEQVLLDQGALDLPTVLRVAGSMCSALSYIHEHGVVHRDVKPSNLMYDRQGRGGILKLTDFGVAKGETQESELTIKGAQLGTIWYMPPEQLASQRSSPSWDVFALAVTLSELWTGRLPLAERSQAAVFRRHLDGDPIPPWPTGQRGTCSELCDLLEAALEIDPEKRLKDLSVFQFLIASVAKHYDLNLAHSERLARVSDDDLKRSLTALSEKSIERLCTIAGTMQETQDITLSVDRQLVSSVNRATDLDDTLLTNVFDDDEQ